MRQKLGQHFLKNKEVLENIADSLELKKGDVVIEIGPGHGELTQYLLNAGVTIIAIEKDESMVEYLCNKFEARSTKLETSTKSKIQNNELNLINGDALKILPVLNTVYDIRHTKYKIVGNIPYYITGHLLRIISELKNKPKLTVLLIQKEVAQRICAKSPQMNLLSASVQFWAEPKIIQNVTRGNFNPPPDVDSAIVLLKTKSLINTDKNNTRIDTDIYYGFIRKIFKQPRKTVLNNLISGGYKKDEVLGWFKNNKIKENCRPQDFDVNMLIKMALEL
ncbi:MAG: 16S rRNA (adenine(1518)-N(6)/adenine(1519)-N(6))-dimethyltransferase RsmA [Candidatus Paceibacterota bacterium]|jgi:16S rRNA (adenine1518-N6/adenine1519-N6)-dimethyltransferase